MAQYRHLEIFRESYRLTRELYKLKIKLPNNMKHDLGDMTGRSSLRLLRAIVIANGSKDKAKPLQTAALEVENLWVFTRLMFDLKGISQGEFKVISEILNGISQQLHNWRTWTRKQKSD